MTAASIERRPGELHQVRRVDPVGHLHLQPKGVRRKGEVRSETGCVLIHSDSIAHDVGTVIVLESLVGLFLGTAAAALIVLSATLYPAPIRSTGVGWAMGVGRVGSFLGPLLVSALLAGGCTVTTVFALLAAPALIAAVTAGLIPQAQEQKGRAHRAPLPG